MVQKNKIQNVISRMKSVVAIVVVELGPLLVFPILISDLQTENLVPRS